MNVAENNPDKTKAIRKDKPMREISVECCELLGKGGNGAVYRLDDETIVMERSE
jgi:hypothetical protein